MTVKAITNATTGSNARLSMRNALLVAIAALICCFAVLAASAGNANAAFNITDFKMTPTGTNALQAGGHPTVHYHIDPDANLADGTTGNGDDLKKVQLDFPAGALGNPEAASPKCSAAQFSTDTCPATSYIGSMMVKLRVPVIPAFNWYTNLNAPGSMYILSPPSPGSAITVGFIVRPPGYRIIFMKTEVTGVAKVRTGFDKDYGLTLTVDNIPRVLTTTSNSSVNATVQDISIDLNPRAGTNQTGPYFTYMPTRCDPSNTLATISSWNGVVISKTDTFTATGCNNLSFNPSASFVPTNNNAGAATGMAATFSQPFDPTTVAANGLPLTPAEVKNIVVDLPLGTGLNFPVIGAIPSICSDAQLNSDTCPVDSKIGSVNAAVPFLPPTMTGDVYLTNRGSSISFGYVLRGSNGVVAPLKGQIQAVDGDNDGESDHIRAFASTMPQVPWQTATINFSTPMILNPTACGANAISSQFTSWANQVVTTGASYNTVNCGDQVAPTVNITAPTAGQTITTASTTATWSISDTAQAGQTASGVNDAATTCSLAGPSAVASALCPGGSKTFTGLTNGSYTLSIVARDNAGNQSTTTRSFSVAIPVDNIAPTVSITAPTAGQVLTTNSAAAAWTITDTAQAGAAVSGVNNAATTCSLAGPTPTASGLCPGGSKTFTGLANGNYTLTVTGKDNAGNTSTPATVAFSVAVPQDTVAPTITGPTATVSGNQISATFSVTDTAQAGVAASGVASVTCALAGPTPSAAAACTSPKVYSGLANGTYSFTLTATDNAGNVATGSVTGLVVNVADNVAPTVNITAPTAGQNFTTGTVNAAWTITDTAQSGVSASGVNDAATACSLSGPTPTASGLCPGGTKSFTGLANGSYTLSVTATDNAGNTSAATTRSFSVGVADNVGPTVTINTPTAGQILATNSAAATWTITDTAQAGVTASGVNDAATTCALAGPTTVASATCTGGAKTFSGLANGAYTLTVVGKDNAGNSTTQTRAFSVAVMDNVAPTINITAPTASQNFTTGTVNAAWTITDTAQAGVTASGVNDSLTTCALAGPTPTASGACPGGTKSFTGLANGSYTLTVNAQDNQGNANSATRSFSVGVVDNVAPTVSISAPTAGQVFTTNSASVTFTATDTAQAGVTPSGVASTTCSLAGPTPSAAATCTSPKAYTGLSNGSYTASVFATDVAGNVGAATTVAFSINVADNVAPTINITAPTAGQNFTTGSVAATWTTADTAQAGVSASGVNDALTTCALAGPTPTASGLCPGGTKSFTGLANGSYTLTVGATDNAGNSNSATRAFSVGVPDTVAPTVSITAPTAGQSFTTNSVGVAFSATDTAQAGVTPSGVASTTCSLTGPTPSAAASCASVKTYSGLSNGSYTASVFATDNAGNVGVASSVSFTVAVVDNIGPTVTITAPTSGQNFTTGSVNATWTISDTAQVGVTPSGVNDAATTCALAGPTPTASGLCPGGTKSFTGLANGSYTLTVVGKDNAGNSTTATQPFSVGVADTVAPTIAINAPTAGQVLTTNSAAATWTLTDTAQAGVTPSGVNDAQTTCALAGPTPTASATCTGGAKTFNGLANGSYTLTVNAKDNAGNTNTATRTFSVAVVDNVAPTVSITAPTAGQVFTTNSVNVAFTATDTAQAGVTPSGVASTTCSLSGPTPSAAAACTSPKTYSGLSNGSYTASVSATDNAGNVGPAATVAFTVNVADNVGPTINVTAPTEGSTVTVDTVATTWTLTDTAQAGVTPSGVNDAQTTCALAGPTPTASGLCPGGAKTFAGLANGNYALTVVAKDNVGNTTTLTRNFIVNRPIDNVAPTVAISSPTAGQSFTVSSVSVAFTATDTAQAGAAVSGVASTTCTLTGPTPSAAAPCTSPKAYSGLANGNYTVSIYATDNAGNSGSASPTTVNFTIAVPGDAVGPTVTISAPTAGQTFTTNSAAAAWTIADTAQAGATASGVNDALTTCGLVGTGGGTTVATTTCPGGAKTFTGLSNGSYTLTVTGTDNAGNAGTPATRTFTVNVPDTGAPVVTITAPTASQVLTTSSAAATWNLTDPAQPGIPASGVNDALTTCGLVGSGGGTTVATATCTGGAKTFTGLTNGNYVLTVTAKDAAGNTGSNTRSFSVAVPDAVGPTVNITAPTAGQTFTTNSVTANWTITDTAQAGVTASGVNDAATTCALTGPTPSASATCTGGTKTFSGLANGSYTLTVNAVDNAGNATTGTTRSFTVAVVDNVAPTVSITAPTAGQVFTTNSVNVAFTATDTAQAGVTASGVASTTCTLTGPTPSAAASCTSPKTYSGLANGSYTASVSATDNAGNAGPAATVAFSVNVVDNVAPTVNITAPTASQVLTTNSAAATWTTADTAQAGVTASGVNDAQTTCALAGPTATASALCPGGAKTFTGLANGSYTLTVTAKDNAGNTSAATTRAFSVAVVDNVAPTVSITAPTAGQVLSTNSAAATWTTADTAQAGVTASGVNDAQTTCALAGPTPTASALCPGGAKTFTGLSNGSYTLTVTAKDNAGNTSTATTVAFSVSVADNVAPTVNITAPTASQVLTTNSAAATWTITDTAQAGVTASGVNDAQTTCSLAGPTPTASATCTGGAKTFSGLANGSYTLTVTAKDNAGNTSAATTRAFSVAVVDNVGPTVTITAPTAGQAFTTGSVTANWTITDTAQAGVTASGVNDAATTCALAGPTPTASGLCPGGTKAFTGLANGSYTLTVVGKDNATNSTTATVSFSVGVADNVAPTVSISAPTAGQTFTTNSASVTFTATDTAQAGVTPSGVASTTCSLAGPTPSAAATCTSPKAYTNLANGSYTASVFATDVANNVGTAATVSFTIAVVDNVGPTVNITAPAASASLTTNSVTATWTSSDTAQAGVTASGVKDSATTCALAGPTPTASGLCPGGTKAFTGLANGSYTLTVTATDNANNVGTPATRSFTVAVPDNVGPTTSITAPAAGASLTVNSATATWTSSDTAQAGVSPSGVNDAATTCSLAGPTATATTTCAGGTKAFTGLANGSYTLTVTATDNAGNAGTPATRSFTVAVVDNVGPTVNITAPTAGQVITTLPLVANWSITDVAQAGVTPSGVNDAQTTCALTGTNGGTSVASALCPGGTKSFSGLANGDYTLTVVGKDNIGNTTTATRAFQVNAVVIPPPPVLTVTQYAAPSANATSLSQAGNQAVFSATNSPTSYSCRSGFGTGGTAVTSQSFTPCTSPWSPTIPAGITSGTNIDYQIKATNAGGDSNIVAGFSDYDTRGFTATPTVTSTSFQAGAHPDVTATLTAQGFDDAKTVDITFPDGLMGSLAAIPVANRCTLDQATAGNCPASALVGTGSGHVTSATDGTMGVGASLGNGTANVYLVDAKPASGTAIPSQYAAGVALQIKGVNGPITGAQGDVNAQGYLSIGDNGRDIKAHIDNIPRQTLTGHTFHIRDVSLTVNGNPAGAPQPLITNPHYCGTFNTNRKSPGSAAFTDQWGNAFAAVPGVVASNFWGSGVSYQGDTTPEIQAPYVVSGCATVPFVPSITASISSTAASTPTTLNTTVAFTTDNSPMRQALVRLPSFVAPNLAAFGDVNLDQCPTTDITFTAGAFGTGAASYSQFTPLACPPSSIVGKAILTSPLLPGTITADVYQVNKAPVPNLGIYVDPNKYGNPQGVTIGLFGTTTTPQVDPLCDPTDTDTNPLGCPSQIVAQFASIPDVPVTSMALTAGNVTGRTLASGQVFPNVLNIAQAADPACVNAGARITSNLTPWSGTAVQSPQSNLLVPTGCNQ